MIRITSKKDGFRRAGVVHSKSPTEYPDDHFSKEQLKALQDEPLLVVEIAEGGQSRPSAKEVIALVEKAETVEELDKLAEGEDRATVKAAIEKRRAELTKK